VIQVTQITRRDQRENGFRQFFVASGVLPGYAPNGSFPALVVLRGLGWAMEGTRGSLEAGLIPLGPVEGTK
jgi:hypothetical protein